MKRKVRLALMKLLGGFHDYTVISIKQSKLHANINSKQDGEEFVKQIPSSGLHR